MFTYRPTLQTHFVTRVIKSDMFEVDPGIPSEIARQTAKEALIAAKGTSVGVSVPPNSTEASDGSNAFYTIRLKNIYIPESETAKDEKAINYLKQLIEKKRVIFNFHPLSISESISDDHIGAYVWRFPDKAFVNALMVYSGHAEWESAPGRANMPPYLPPRVSRI